MESVKVVGIRKAREPGPSRGNDSMDEKTALEHKYKLKNQALQLIREERKAIRRRLFLLDLIGGRNDRRE